MCLLARSSCDQHSKHLRPQSTCRGLAEVCRRLDAVNVRFSEGVALAQGHEGVMAGLILPEAAKGHPGQWPGGQVAQFVVHQRQELLGGVRVALLDGRQDAGDFDQGETTNVGRGISASDYTDRNPSTPVLGGK